MGGSRDIKNALRKAERRLHRNSPGPEERGNIAILIAQSIDLLAAAEAERDAALAEVARLRKVLWNISKMAEQGADAPMTAERWLDRIDETAITAHVRTGIAERQRAAQAAGDLFDGEG